MGEGGVGSVQSRPRFAATRGGICRISLLGLVPGFSSLRSRGPSHYSVVSDPCSVTSVVVPTVCWAPTEIYRELVPCSAVARFNPSPLACNDISYLRMTSNESPLDMSEDPSVCNGSCRNANYCSFFAFSIVSNEGLMTDNLRTSSRCCWLTSLTWISICCFSPYIRG